MLNFTVTSTIKHPPATNTYLAIKRKIMGVRYELSLTFVGQVRAATLNRRHRQKTYIPNVLSFPLTKTVGEIFICPAVAKKEASKFNLSPTGYMTFLFIHGCLHLKGYAHGNTMDKMERKYLKAFSIS